MGSGQLEVERKFEAGPDVVLPDLTAVDGVATVGEVVPHELDATYYDTPDLRLARARITLRRRTGGTDAGWHLKLPTAVASSRREVHAPIGPRRTVVPRAVTEPVTGVLRGARPGPVAVLQTTRLVTPLFGDDGRVLAEVASDTVTGTALAAGADAPSTVTTWREIEVELVDGDEALLDAVTEALTAAGIEPSDQPSKLSRVLADRLAALAPPPLRLPAATGDGTDPGPGSGKGSGSGKKGKKGKKRKDEHEEARRDAPTAAEVVLAAVRTQVRALQTADIGVRTGDPEGVHDLRVACRRLRSILAAFRPVLDRTATDPLRDELQVTGARLSAARDGEVALEHLRAVVDAQPVELVRGPVVARLQSATVADHEKGRRAAVRALSDERHLQLLDALDALLADPPLAEAAAGPAPAVLADAVRRTGKRLRHRVAEARDAAAQDEGVQAGTGAAGHEQEEHALHEVRKAAKRVRYTAEVAAPVLGAPAEALVTCTKQVQDLLGQAQDTVVTRAACTRLAAAATGAGEDTFTYGRLHALEEWRAERADQAFWSLEPSLRSAVRAAAEA
ncbi:CHAD domain-containing protein [Geodermatophilus bullaregiensis]|uniref:CYTH and CHAD domain-containing protein n=1 Tax=Geodermatophilus bullaregiensis TaxID=1564160 RepID=UPI00195EC060|nr:CYTH and CHAD domain-containing protein [Geodermatophilus bullaregiensis]MBM7806648.1 CHAD domain-containing protein [Geodermatophilus bullaregiensis]